MRVVFILDKYESKTGSYYSIISGLVNYFSKKKIIVNILTSDLRKKNKKKFYNLISKSDICHFFGGWSFFHIVSFFMARKLKKIRIIHPMGFYEPWALQQKKLKKKLAWYLYQKKILSEADLIHCASNKEKKNILNLNQSFNTKVLPFGIAKKFISIKKEKKILYKKALFFSRIDPVKGIETLVDCWKKLENKDWILDVVGPKENKYFYNKIKNLIGNSNKINYLKPIFTDFEKIKLFNNYDLLILPSKNENFSMVVLESLGRGLPVLTTTETPWKIIKYYNAGWIINSKRSSLLLCLKNIFKLDLKKFNLKSKNAIDVAKNFQIEHVYKNYIKTYLELLKKK
jgi:glycosyltransferase involved in cell wall biosynthesis